MRKVMLGVKSELTRFCDVIQVVWLNSQKYDLNLVKAKLAGSLIGTENDLRVIKKGTGYASIVTPKYIKLHSPP